MRAAVSFQIYDDFTSGTSAAWRFLALCHRRGEKNPVPAPQNRRRFAVPHAFEAKRSGTGKAWENNALDKLRLIGLFVAR
jgi:hypothetical protein